MNILIPSIVKNIKNRVFPALAGQEFSIAEQSILSILETLYDSIPAHKRISYGRVYTIKILCDYLYHNLGQPPEKLFETGSRLFEESTDYRVIGIGLGMISWYGLEEPEKTLPCFLKAAASEMWEVREFVQMFFKKLIKNFPDRMHVFLDGLATSPNPNIRRFVAETLRPASENRWFYKNPEYSLSILRKLFRETVAYPRTSVGNNLSDLARRLPELVYSCVSDLVKSGDKNSYWIAYRACRNLVKKEPRRVMDILKIDKYKYKERVHTRDDL